MTIEDLKETAALAHLNLDESELSAAFPAFEQMLGYFAVMQAADEDALAFPEGFASFDQAGASNNSEMVNSGFFRSDSAGSPDYYKRSGENLLNNAGERDGRFLVIPNVLER